MDYYGAPTPIQQVASVAVSEARTLTISPWDQSVVHAVEKAIQSSDLGINPQTDGKVILLHDDRPGAERLLALVLDDLERRGYRTATVCELFKTEKP